MSKPSNTTRPVCLTDGAVLFYPQGCGVVRAISLTGLAICGMTSTFGTHTVEVGLVRMIETGLKAVAENAPPARWTDPRDPLGFPEDFADLLGAWLDWCDEQEAVVEEAVGGTIGAAAGVPDLGSKVQRAAELMTGGLGFSAIARLAVQHFDALDHGDLLAEDCEASGLPGLIKEIHDALNREADERAAAE